MHHFIPENHVVNDAWLYSKDFVYPEAGLRLNLSKIIWILPALYKKVWDSMNKINSI